MSYKTEQVDTGTYYVRVRGFYKADGGKEYGPWSTAVTVTTGSQPAAPAPAVKVKSYILNNDILSLLGMSMDQVKSKYASVTTVKVGSVSGMNTIGLGNPAIEMYFTNKGCFFLAGNLSTLVGKTVPQLTASKLLDELGINAGYIGECQEIKEADPKKSVLTTELLKASRTSQRWEEDIPICLAAIWQQAETEAAIFVSSGVFVRIPFMRKSCGCCCQSGLRRESWFSN